MCYLFKQTVFVYCCDLDEDQIKLYDQFMQKSRYFQRVHILFLATVYASLGLYSALSQDGKLVVEDIPLVVWGLCFGKVGGVISCLLTIFLSFSRGT